MELQNKEMQMLVVEKVLEEMKNAEQYLMCWHVGWLEVYDYCALPQEYLDNFHEDNLKLDNECSKIGDTSILTDKWNGVPLKHIVLGNKYVCDVLTIIWHSIKTNNTERTITFENSGEINLSKKPLKCYTKQKRKLIDYQATYNVLSNNFKIDIEIIESPRPISRHSSFDKILIELSGNTLLRRYNGIEIIDDLTTGLKCIRITKKHDKQNNASVDFKILLNPDNTLEMGALAINTHKGNGKVNGTYRFDVSRKKGVRANFYSRKGIKVDLVNNPMLLETANRLMSTNSSSSDIMITSFAESTQKAIMKNLSERVVCFDLSNFNMDAVITAEEKVIEILKTIRGEIPLSGLVERIDYCLSLVDKKKQLKGYTRTLKIDSNN